MPAAFSVSDADISYAEGLLLPPGEFFDDERRTFIRNLDTLDLQAVPGSGKTTALLAKLLILDRHLPFADGSGVMVISHTNAAIDEIKDKIGTHCKNLFSYPNFVGTIQGFVDEFLAVPFYANKYFRLPLRIDDEIYNQAYAKMPFAIKDFTQQETNNARRYLMASTKVIRWSLVGGKKKLTEGYCGKDIDFKKPKGRTLPANYTDWSVQEKDRVRLWITKFKARILNDGYLCYDDAYFLASVSLSENPAMKLFLQKRFRYVFVDEMQDMEQHQHDLLEAIFFDSGSCPSTYQRIGDKNQSIFDGRNSTADGFWIDRATVLELNGSYRLSEQIAKIVSPFAVSPLRIEGRRRNPDGSPISVKPRFIVFSDSTTAHVIPRFASIVQSECDSGRIRARPSNKYSAVAWATQQEANKVRLCDYFPSYSKDQQRPRPDYPNLQSYLANLDMSDGTLGTAERNICNALLRVLREEGIPDPLGGQFTRRRMREFLRETAPEYWLTFQEKIYEWSLGIIQDASRPAVLKDIKEGLEEFVRQFGGSIVNSKDFVHATGIAAPPIPFPAGTAPGNLMKFGDIDIQVSTVHRVKGETHTATLYMESFYEKKSGGGNYESERLIGPFKGDAMTASAHGVVRQSAKMVYVGFSRPTHLLCFAVHESRFSNLESVIDKEIWEIVRL